MSDNPFVDNDGDALPDYAALREYQSDNRVDPIDDTVSGVLIVTSQSGLVRSFKTVVTCEADQENVYHGHIEECDGQANAVAMHAEVKRKIEAGESFDEHDELIVIEDDQ